VKGSKVEVTAPKTATEWTVPIVYGNGVKGCTAFGVAATVNMNSCHYKWALVASSVPATATVDVVCTTAGDAITITASSLPCTVTIGAQAGLKHVTFTNNPGSGGPADITAKLALENLAYTTSGVGCPKAGTFSNGKYTGTLTLEAFNDPGPSGSKPYPMSNKVGLHVGAPGAPQGPELHCTSSTTGCTLWGQSSGHVFSLQGATVGCKQYEGVAGARFEATVPKTGTSATIKAAYGVGGKGCTWPVQVNGCDYTLNFIEGSSPATATVDITCTAGGNITLTAVAYDCTITIGPQNGLGHVTFSNSGGAEPTDVTAEFSLEKIKYTATGSWCPKPGTSEDGKYQGTLTLEGFEDPGPAGSEPYPKGNKVGLHVF